MQCFKKGLVGINGKMGKIAWNDVERRFFFSEKNYFDLQFEIERLLSLFSIAFYLRPFS